MTFGLSGGQATKDDRIETGSRIDAARVCALVALILLALVPQGAACSTCEIQVMHRLAFPLFVAQLGFALALVIKRMDLVRAALVFAPALALYHILWGRMVYPELVVLFQFTLRD